MPYSVFLYIYIYIYTHTQRLKIKDKFSVRVKIMSAFPWWVLLSTPTELQSNIDLQKNYFLFDF